MTKINEIPPFAEEITIENTEQTIQEILNRDEFKKPISNEFVKLTNAKKNNWGSTEGLDKPLCERYLFIRENKSIYLDIPYNLMEELEIPIGKSFPWPFYLKSKVLEPRREEVEGAITIKSENEIFIDKPISEKNVKKELVERLKELKGLRGKVERLEKVEKEKEELQEQGRKFWILFLLMRKKNDKLWHRLFKLEGEKYKLEKEIKKWSVQFTNQTPQEIQKKIGNLTNEKTNLQTELNKTKAELQKELFWWNKWKQDVDTNYKISFGGQVSRNLDDRRDEYLSDQFKEPARITVVANRSIDENSWGSFSTSIQARDKENAKEKISMLWFIREYYIRKE